MNIRDTLLGVLRYVLGVRCTGCLYGLPELGGLRNKWYRGHAARLKKTGTIGDAIRRGMRDAETVREKR